MDCGKALKTTSCNIHELKNWMSYTNYMNYKNYRTTRTIELQNYTNYKTTRTTELHELHELQEIQNLQVQKQFWWRFEGRIFLTVIMDLLSFERRIPSAVYLYDKTSSTEFSYSRFRGMR